MALLRWILLIPLAALVIVVSHALAFWLLAAVVRDTASVMVFAQTVHGWALAAFVIAWVPSRRVFCGWLAFCALAVMGIASAVLAPVRTSVQPMLAWVFGLAPLWGAALPLYRARKRGAVKEQAKGRARSARKDGGEA